MSDDIVTRLMNWSDESTVLWEAVYELRDSKKEIERLRKMLAHGLTQGFTCEGCSTCEELKAFHKKVVPDGNA